MTIKEIKDIAKEKYGKDLTDEQAQAHLDHLQELENAGSAQLGCGNPNDPDPGLAITDKIKYIELHNFGGFVAELGIKYQSYTETTQGGSTIRTRNETKLWEDGKDILNPNSRIVDIKDTGIPDGSDVWIKFVVNGGYDRIGQQRFTYSKDSKKVASYQIKGTTCNSSFAYNGVRDK